MVEPHRGAAGGNHAKSMHLAPAEDPHNLGPSTFVCVTITRECFGSQGGGVTIRFSSAEKNARLAAADVVNGATESAVPSRPVALTTCPAVVS